MKRFVKPFMLLFLVVAALYAPSARDGFVYDDREVIQAHPGIASAADLWRIFRERHFPNLPYYRPVTRATLLLQKGLHGEDPAPFHLFNAALMGVAAVLAYALLTLPAFGVEPSVAWLAAAIFALHPAASSCVYPISSGRETLMPAVFTLLAVYSWLRSGRGWRILAYASFTAALFSKEQAVVVPLLFALADVLRLSPTPPRRAAQWLARYVPLAAIGVIYFGTRLQLFGGGEYHRGSLAGPLLSIAYAVQTVVTPYRELIYEPSVASWFSPARFAAAIAVIGILMTLAVRRPLGRRGAFWLGWFLLALLPTANILKQEAHYDERYVFLPSLAVIVIGAMLASRRGFAPILCAAALCLICTYISVARASVFEDDISFAEQWLRTDPENVNANFTMGIGLARQQRWTESLPYYEKSARLQPDVAEVHARFGIALAQLEEMDQALEQFRIAVRLKPGAADLHNNLANALASRSLYSEALIHYREALRLRPDYVEAQRNLALVLQYTASHP
jgi:tetratricopeptide (TPR) repeat protein